MKLVTDINRKKWLFLESAWNDKSQQLFWKSLPLSYFQFVTVVIFFHETLLGSWFLNQKFSTFKKINLNEDKFVPSSLNQGKN